MSKRFRLPSRLPAKLEQLGVRLAVVLRHAELPAALFESPKILLNTDELFAFWRSIGTVCDDPLIGLKLGSESKPEFFDPIGLAALSANTFGDAVEQVSRHKRLSCPEEIAHWKEGNELAIQFRWLLAKDQEPSILVDLCFAWILSIGRVGSGTTLVPLRVELMRQEANSEAIRQTLGCPVIFNAPCNTIVFRAEDAALPFVTRNAELLAMLAPQLDAELNARQRKQQFSDVVRSEVRLNLAGHRPMIQVIARRLHLSPRTLQRRLRDEGSSFQQVVEEARRQLAYHYLTDSALELNETAYLLGYEDANSFVRAFRLWEGVPPAQWRSLQQLEAPAS
jgi:AraC-like DNA-binding protein